MHAATAALPLSTEELTLRVLLQLAAIVVISRVSARVMRHFGQTDVGGEILVGVLLGPSLLGALWPTAFNQLFPAVTVPVLTNLSQLGLILLTFEIGLEFEFSRNLGGSRRPILLISGLGVVTPFVLGAVTAPWFLDQLPGAAVDALGFQLFFATAMSITAIPILGRIFMELGLSHTRIAAVTIGAAAIDDVVGWLCLGAVSALVAGNFELGAFGLRLAGLVAFAAILLVVLGPRLRNAIVRGLDHGAPLSSEVVAAVLVVMFVAAAATSALGVFAVIGSFLAGVVFHSERAFVARWKASVSPLVRTLFVPVFFVHTGLRTDIAALDTQLWGICAAVVAVAFAGKYAGAYAGARLAGERPMAAFAVGTCMNTRALMELVVLDVGWELGVIPTEMFTMLVIMALASTLIATPLIRWSMTTVTEGERTWKPLPRL